MGLDFRYTDNCVASGSANTLGMKSREPVYLRGTLGTDGLFYLDPITVTYSSNSYKRAWVQLSDATNLSTSPFDTSHVYWFIGYAYYNSSYVNSQYQFDLHSSDSLMMWNGSQLIPYSKAAPVTSVNNKTGAVTLSAADVGALSTHQNEYGKIKVGTSTTTADAVQDTIEFAAGGNMSVTISGDKITYSYTTPASLPANGGNAASLGGSAPAYYLSYGNFTGTPSTLPNAKKLNIYANADTTALIGYSGGETADTTFRINASTTNGAFNITNGTTTKTIQLAGSFTDTTYGAQSGITLANSKYGHANAAITAQTTQAVYPIKIDAYGHITAYGDAVTIPAAQVNAD